MEVSLQTKNPLWNRMKKHAHFLMSHTDEVKKVPDGFQTIATTTSCVVAGIASQEHPWYGIQFHPEITEDTSRHDRD